MQIKILGTGCRKCNKLADAANEAVKMSGMDAEVVKVEKIEEIMKYGIAMTPGLVFDEKVVSTGKVPSPEKIASMIKEHSQEK